MSLQLFFNKFIKILKSGLTLFCLALGGGVVAIGLVLVFVVLVEVLFAFAF